MNQDEIYMRRCLQLASYASGHVAPNPMVGAVLVHDDKIIGEGYHQRYGEAHAEPNAIFSVENEDLLKESTLYVNLEPCSHHGKTPPCADLIVEKGIPEVIIGSLDPNPKVAGKGVEILEKAGVKVKIGVLENECKEFNKRFYTHQIKKRPYIILKWAQTRDGFIDIIRESKEIEPLRISHQTAKHITHKIRTENQAIMVSTNTVVLDDPSLSARHWPGKHPIRVILDRTGRVPKDYRIFNELSPTLVFTEKDMDDFENIQFIKIKFDENFLTNMFASMAEKGIHSVLIEGGTKFLTNIITEKLWDEAYVEISNQKIKNGVPAPMITADIVSSQKIDNHLFIKYINPQENIFNDE